MCEITGVGPIAVSVARSLLGESVLKLVITRGVDVLNVTHLGRGPTVAQRIAALQSDKRKVSAVYATPLERTRETEAPIGKALVLRVRRNQGLLEADFGS